jgi:hypothetical protein
MPRRIGNLPYYTGRSGHGKGKMGTSPIAACAMHGNSAVFSKSPLNSEGKMGYPPECGTFFHEKLEIIQQ